MVGSNPAGSAPKIVPEPGDNPTRRGQNGGHVLRPGRSVDREDGADGRQERRLLVSGTGREFGAGAKTTVLDTGGISTIHI